MKKIFISILCLLSFYSTSNAIFGDINSLNLYKDIDAGVIDLDTQMTSFELKGGKENPGILAKINTLALLKNLPECLDESKNLSEGELKNIIKEANIKKISMYIDQSCAKQGGGFQIKTLTDTLTLFRVYSKNSIKRAKKKAGQIYKLSTVGIYTDGDLKNSAFDLIKDIENIDKIIFNTDTKYDGKPNEDITKELEKMFGGIVSSMDKLNDPKKNNSTIGQNINYSAPINNDYSLPKNIYKPTTPENIDNTSKISLSNKYACVQQLGDNGLKTQGLEFLLNNIANNIEGVNSKATNKNNESDKGNNIGNGKAKKKNNGTEKNTQKKKKILGKYSKVVDNSEWPCEKFFCINIDFTMYEQGLFSSPSDMTIESLLNRSNKHLKKYASTSLIPAKMSLNNFELGLKDLNLADIFHMGFQISTKPIPILNIEKTKKEDATAYSAKNMLEAYYKANGLNYKRRNDLVLLKNVEQEKQTILNSDSMAISNAKIKQTEYYNNYFTNEKKDISLLKKSIEKKVSSGVMSTFEKQYIEIDKFTDGITNYIENMYSIIKQMNKIPNG